MMKDRAVFASQEPTCVGHVRLVPTFLVDVAGLVLGAAEGRGRGNAFLSDLANCDALIQVVDAAGLTDIEGNPIAAISDVESALKEETSFLTEELDSADLRNPWTTVGHAALVECKQKEKKASVHSYTRDSRDWERHYLGSTST